MNNQESILSVKGLGIDFGGLTAVNKFNIEVGKTDIYGLIGPNGAGKTTVFNMLTKVYTPSRGTIIFDNKDTSKMNSIDVNKAGIARTFQNIRLFANQSVLDNVLVGMHNSYTYSAFDAIIRSPKFKREEQANRKKAMELLEIFDLAHSADVPAKSLPYGAQRRLEIARALASSPKLLLLDEPAAGMNPVETE